MAFENDTNRGRVRKMAETLDLVLKSAASIRTGAPTSSLGPMCSAE